MVRGRDEFLFNLGNQCLIYWLMEFGLFLADDSVGKLVLELIPLMIAAALGWALRGNKGRHFFKERV